MDVEAIREQALIVGTVVSATIAGIFGGKKIAANKPETTEAQVLAASIVPHSEMKALTAATTALQRPIERLVELLEADAHRREVAAEVEAELRKKGLLS